VTQTFRRVAHGLSLVTAGSLVMLFVWLVVVAGSFDVGPRFYEIRYLFLAILAVGLGLSLAGRRLCLAVPPGARGARAWGVLAVTLDGCGLFSAVTNFILAQSGIWLGPVIVLVAVLFSLGALLLGRVAFHFYLWSLAKHIDDRPLTVRTLTVFWHAVGLTGVIVVVTWFLSFKGMDRPLAQCWLLVITLAILHWTWRYVRVLFAVRWAVQEYQPPRPDPADDPDREYRERYQQELAEGRVEHDDD
jgi:hypothetical protein